MKFAYPPGATPLDPDAAAGLLIRADTQQQLDEAEALNIQIAVVFLETHAVSKDFPTDGQLRELHRRMFDRVWRWAGTYPKSDTNIGVHWTTIPEQMRNLCADLHTRLDQGAEEKDHDDDDRDQVCAWFHWKVVWIHAFPNGNGRHARLATNRLRQRLDLPPWTWGSASLNRDTDARRGYIAALKAADAGNLLPLLKFVQGG